MTVVFPRNCVVLFVPLWIFEPDLTKIVMKHLKSGQTFFDVGTHFGYYSMLASKLVSSEGHVHCFEPTTDTYKIVQSIGT